MFYFPVGMNVILRYLFVKNLLILKKTPPTARWYKLNLAGLVLGVLSAFGLSMVANFQVSYNTGACELYLSYDIAPRSEITPCNKIADYRFSRKTL